MLLIFPLFSLLMHTIFSVLKSTSSHCKAYWRGKTKRPSTSISSLHASQALDREYRNRLGAWAGGNGSEFALGMLEIALDMVASLALICVVLYGPSQGISCS
jgi:hypothetical protein